MKQKKKNSKISLGELIWMGFNFTTGIAFTAVFYSTMNLQQGGIGIHAIWVFVVDGIIAGLCAWCYAKLSRIHKGENGAAYIYTRTNFGKFAGWIVSLFQFMTIPVIITSQVVSMIRINFINPGPLHAEWGRYTYLWLDLIGIAIFAVSSLVLLFGMQAFKKFFKYSSYIKWGTTFILIIGALVLFFYHGFGGFNNIANYAKTSKIGATNFSSVFTSAFFFFLGFETYSTIGRNVQHPEKNIGRAVIAVMALTTIFMVFISFIFIGAIVSNGAFTSNPNIQIFTILGNKQHFNSSVLGIIGAIVMIICAISLKFNAAVSAPLYASSILQAFGKEGFIKDDIGHLSKENISNKGVIWSSIIILAFLFIWLVIPDVVYGTIYNYNNKAEWNSEQGKMFGYAVITGEVSVMLIFIYIVVTLICIKLAFTDKLKAKLWEKITFIGLLAFLVWQFITWWYSLFYDMVHKSDYLKGGMEIAFMSLGLIAGILIYFLYYKPKYKKRLLKDPKIQEELDSHFKIQDDWDYTAKIIEDDIVDYIKRNKAIFKDENHASLAKAQKYLENIILSEGDLVDKDAQKYIKKPKTKNQKSASK